VVEKRLAATDIEVVQEVWVKGAAGRYVTGGPDACDLSGT